jgi:TolB-like protein
MEPRDRPKVVEEAPAGVARSPGPAIAPGTRLGPYEIVALIGAGGMGEVYRGTDTRLGREVAVKVLPSHFAADREHVRRFEREARAVASLNHPHILTVHDVGTHEGTSYVVTELLEGQTLRERLARHPPTVEECLSLAAQVAQGLAAAHRRGVVHRDIKPENLFVTSDGVLKILDFGLARHVPPAAHGEPEPTQSTETREGVVVGTVAYMAPEQARGMPVDCRADVFAFGVVLYEMLSGRHPFRAATPTDTVATILRDEPPLLPAHVPAPLAAVVRRCLAKEPGQRYQGGGELKVAFDALQHAAGAAGRASRRDAPRSRRGAGRRRVRSLVVLPLLDFSRDPEQDYFVDGMTEALIADLAKIRALRVISRTSSMRYKGTQRPLPEVAAELGVDGVLEGSVMRAGRRVRITAQLIHAATDTHLWAESYERDLEDVLLLQSEVVRAIADEIRIAVTPEEAKRLASPRPVHPEAYDACLKGCFHWSKLSREHLGLALRYFESALEKDPRCARAWAGIASTWFSLTDAGFVPPHEAIPKAKEAALRALELDDSLAEVRVTLANLRFCNDWDWSEAEREFRKAIELHPGSADAHFFYADFLISMGRNAEAEAEARRALELDPFSFFIQGFFGWHLVYLGRGDEAIAQLRRTLQMESRFSSAHLGLWGAFYRKGLRGEALAAAREFFEVLGDGEVVEALRRGESDSGYEGAMRLAALELERRAAGSHVPAVRIARLWAHAGDVDRALEWLEKAHASRESPLVHLKVGWDWDSLRGDPRFHELLDRMQFPD